MIVKVPDAIDEAQSGTCFCSIGRQGVQAGWQAGSVRPRSQIHAGRYCAVRTDIPRNFRSTMSLLCCALYVVYVPQYCTLLVACRTVESRLTDCQIGAARGAIESRALHRQTRPQRAGILCCARVEHWSFSPCPPHRPRLGQGSLGKASPGTGSWSCS